MTALVGHFAPGGDRWYRARPVDLEGQPSWLLGQMHAMWRRKFSRDTEEMVAALLDRDWCFLANTEWPPAVVADEEGRWVHVTGVGRAHPLGVSGRALVGRMPADPPGEGEEWAYLWEYAYGALHVYVAVAGRWEHIATLPLDVWAGLTDQLVLDVQARRGWMERAA